MNKTIIALVSLVIGSASLAQAQQGGMLADRFRRLDGNGDGSIEREEFGATRFGQRRPEMFDRFDSNRDSRISRQELASGMRWVRPASPTGNQIDESQPARPGEPPLRRMPSGDAAAHARGRGQLFESIVVEGFTDIPEGTNGFAVADLNRDGFLDMVATFSPPRGSGRAWREGEKLRVFINQGEFRFKAHPIRILDSNVSPDDFGRGQVPSLADFNGDGFLDILVTRHARMSGGRTRSGVGSRGNSLLVSQGAWHTFKDVASGLGIRNEQAYNRQTSIGDVNRDGWLDIAIGCDNIGNAMGGFPHSRLYVFQPKGRKFEDGRFKDIGGTPLVPDFGGFYHDSAKDKAGPDITLRDLDNDGDLDLVQSFHCDVREPLLPYSPGEYRQGVFCWKNLLAETSKLRFNRVTGNGLACEAILRYDRRRERYVPAGRAVAPGLPYVAMADVDNDGLLDVFATGPSDKTWSPRVEYVGGRFWQNLGGFRFQEATQSAGLAAIDNTYRQWYVFFGVEMLDFHRNYRPYARHVRSQPGMTPPNPIDNRPYYADAVFGDFDNDGWQDLVVLDRRETQRIQARAILFMNRGDGTFEPKPTTWSGLDAPGISAEAADLNNDGLLDLVIAADPDNSGRSASPERYMDKVYWNAGRHGARQNHWLRLRFGGLRDAELVGACVTVHEPGTGELLGMRVVFSSHTYKSGGALESHFGLGKRDHVDVRVMLLSGRKVGFKGARANRFLDLDLRTNKLSVVETVR